MLIAVWMWYTVVLCLPSVGSGNSLYETDDLEKRVTRIENLLQKTVSSLNKIIEAVMGDESGQALVRSRRHADDEGNIDVSGLTLEDLRTLIGARTEGDGSPGLNGQDGADGEQGPPGPPGPPGITGSVYTRWGRTTCGNATTIYRGFAANTAYNQEGGGVNYQCLPLNPQFDSFGVPGSLYATISGVEYQVTNDGSQFNGKHDQNVPCAQCYTTASAILMIPARRECPSGWHLEYEGALMTERAHAGHVHSTTFECVDSNPEVIVGQESDTNGALFQFVKPICGHTTHTTGHCPPYRSDRKLLCAVCSR